mmetsp:Transcript_16576/g.19108  ORF Transcript_16576/g.19108 Transcript_16576/m.19108 type:complete len:89 (+) Transcript_16576:92-358(+)
MSQLESLSQAILGRASSDASLTVSSSPPSTISRGVSYSEGMALPKPSDCGLCKISEKDYARVIQNGSFDTSSWKNPQELEKIINCLGK